MTIDISEIIKILYRIAWIVLFAFSMDFLCSVALSPKLGSPGSHLLTRITWVVLVLCLATVSLISKSADEFCLVSIVCYSIMPFVAYKGSMVKKILTTDVMLNMICITECLYLLFNKVNGVEFLEIYKKVFIWNEAFPMVNVFDIIYVAVLWVGVFFLKRFGLAKMNPPVVQHQNIALWSILSNMAIYTAMLIAGHGMIGKDVGTVIVAMLTPMAALAFSFQLSYKNTAIRNDYELMRVKKHYSELEAELQVGRDKQRYADEVYGIEHDLKNHIAVIEMLNLSKNYEQIEKYVTQLVKKIKAGDFSTQSNSSK